MRHLGQIDHEDLIGNRLADRNRELHCRISELLRIEQALHRYDLRFSVGNFDANGTFARHGRYNADTNSRQRHGNVLLQVLNLRNAHPLLRRHLIERHRRANSGCNLHDFHVEAAQHLDDAALICVQLFHVYGKIHHLVLIQKRKRGKLVARKVSSGIVGL